MSSAQPGPLMVDVDGAALSAEDRDLLVHPAVGGVILFGRNCVDASQVAALTQEIRQLRSPRLLIAIDQEGGRVQRLRAPLTRLPPAAAYGIRFAADADAAEDLAREAGWLMAVELLAIGVDLSFAPVLDLNLEMSSVIGDRAFASTPQAVSRLAGAFAGGMNEAGMAACGKHFPGHGAVAGDSHDMLPVDGRSLKEIEAADLIPFRALIGQGLQAMMMAHVRYPAVDAQPASLSARWIGALLRERWGFEGAVFCDDLSMNGAASVGGYRERARLALEAGCDMLPVCNNREAVGSLLDHVLPNQASAARVARLRGHDMARGWEELQRTSRWRRARRLLEQTTG